MTAIDSESPKADEDIVVANDTLDMVGDGTALCIENIGLGLAEDISAATFVGEDTTLTKEISDIVM